MTSNLPGPEDEAEFQRVSAEFVERLDAVRAVESRKAALPPGDPERPALALRVEALSLELLTLSRYQTMLAAAQAADVAAPRPPAVVLAAWREAVRRLEESSVTATTHADEAARLHAEYRRSVEERMR